MAKNTSTPTLKHRIEYFGFRGLQMLCNTLSVEHGTAFVSALSRFFGRYSPLNKRALRNLGLAMPNLDAVKRQEIVTGMFDCLSRNAIEYLHLKTLLDDEKRIEIKGQQNLTDACAAGRGVVLVTGHFGNWEAVRVACMRMGHPPAIIYRAFNNPLVDAECKRLMQAIDAPIFHKGKRGTLGLLRHIRKGGVVMILTDQRFAGAPELPFFGHPAQTSLAAAELAQQYGASLLPVNGVRQGKDSRFNVTFENAITVGDGENAAREAMIGINASLERWINKAPEQYFWLHNRWGKNYVPK